MNQGQQLAAALFQTAQPAQTAFVVSKSRIKRRIVILESCKVRTAAYDVRSLGMVVQNRTFPVEEKQ